MVELESLFKLHYGLCILGSTKDEAVNGCIANTIFQVTPEPPMIAVSLNTESLTNEYILKSGTFTVSILSEQAPMPMIGKFGFRSGRDINKFENVNYRTGRTGGPIVLDDTVAFIEAQVKQRVDILTHTLFIAQIVACETMNDEAVPMTYAYYRDVKHGRTPRSAATYIKTK